MIGGGKRSEGIHEGGGDLQDALLLTSCSEADASRLLDDSAEQRRILIVG
jgi:hypothetical protein